jgi:uncharacterized protein (DUF952 family)
VTAPVTDLPSDPDEVFHLVLPDGWAEAERTGTVVPPTFAAEGFVHCSTGAQLAATVARHYAGVGELVVLRLDRDRIAPDLRWEPGRPGVDFPHVYRPLERADVVEVIRWRRG